MLLWGTVVEVESSTKAASTSPFVTMRRPCTPRPSGGGCGEGFSGRQLDATISPDLDDRQRSPTGWGPSALDTPDASTETTAVNYDEFKSVFMSALRESGLPMIGLTPEEVLGLRSADRTFTLGVEPIDREIGRPFHIAATISFRWDAIQTARTLSCEEDLLVELLGREDAQDIETARPSLRVDVKLRASLAWGKGMPMPAPATWAKWSREALGRLETIEPLISEDVMRESPDGYHAILGWQGDPEMKVTCNALGELRLEAISVSAFQMIDLPRKWDDPEREPDDDPHEQLRAMFARVRAALHAWGEVMDHLRVDAR